jgi:hypothetical protein
MQHGQLLGHCQRLQRHRVTQVLQLNRTPTRAGCSANKYDLGSRRRFITALLAVSTLMFMAKRFAS